MDPFASAGMSAPLLPPKFPTTSTIAIPSLETIAGSAAPTPCLEEADAGENHPPTPPEMSLYQPATSPRSSSLGLPLGPGSPSPRRSSLVGSIAGSGPRSEVDLQSIRTAPSDYLTPLEGPASRRSSLVVAGSYFPTNAKAGPSTLPYSPSASGTSTPADRPRPAPLAIPLGTPDEPLFSAYPDTAASTPSGPSRANSTKGKARNFHFPLKPAFALNSPKARRRDVDHGQAASTLPPSASTGLLETGSRPKGRRRASTYSYSGSPPASAPSGDERKRTPLSPFRSSLGLPNSPERKFKSFRRRRVSVHGHEHDTYRDDETWDRMPAEEARRFDARQVPYSYQHPADSEYTLQSVSTVATVRPLAGSPHISPRRSSLTPVRTITPSRVMLGLTNMSEAEPPVEIVAPDDMTMPHGPPPRRSSLDYGSTVRLVDPKAVLEQENAAAIPPDHGSVLSASLTGTDTSASAEFFSTSPSTKEHPLSSATTSLSRSAKSGKEGLADEKDAALAAIRLQRSLEWEARQTRHRRRLEKRRMILLELVETEVAYMGDLTILVQVYLPQLYALPSISERTADLISRNARELLDIHARLAGRMADVLKEEKLGYDFGPEPMVSSQLERASRKLAALFVDEVSSFAAYNDFCAGSIAAATLVRHISQRPDYNSFERRCQIISAAQPHVTLRDMLSEPAVESPEPISMSTSLPAMGRSVPSSPSGTASNRSRLHFRDFLIMPIQRICRYPLLLNQLLGAATTPSPVEEREHPLYPDEVDGDYDTGVDVERALGAMRGVAEEADEARRLKENEIKSATVVERLEPHHALSPAFLKSLGQCRLIGSLDVLHHHPVVAPLVAPVKVKYLGAFLYRGYLILAKVKKGKVYEAKHFLPLEVFELIDITEGFLPHSIRLSLRDHNFDLAASCETEKEVWAAALCQARDESTIPPFELPASVSPFAARARRMSTTMPADFTVPLSPVTGSLSSATKRHTLAVGPDEISFPIPPVQSEQDDQQTTEPGEIKCIETPLVSPIRTSFGFTPERTGRASSILLRRASATQRLLVDRMLIDVFSESCATARSKAQLHHALFLPDLPSSEAPGSLIKRDSSLMLRRRRSFLDSRHTKQTSFDIAFSGEIKGSVMPVRQTRSYAGKKRSHPGKKFVIGNESSTEVDNRHAAVESADETATGSDFGTLTRGQSTGYVSAAPSVGSLSRPPSPGTYEPIRRSNTGLGGTIGLAKRKSLTNIRKSIDAASESTSNLANILTLTRRKTASSHGLIMRPGSVNRAKSMPSSPVVMPAADVPPVPDLPDSTVGVSGSASGKGTTREARPTRRDRGTLSAHTSPARRPVSMAHFSPQVSTDGEDVPVWTRGKGFTNQMPIVPDRGTSWASLKRSMSFIRDKDVSSGSGSGSGSGSASASSASAAADVDGPRQTSTPSASASSTPAYRPATLRRQSTDWTAHSHESGLSSVAMSDGLSGEGDDEAELGAGGSGSGGRRTGDEVGASSVGESPRRRRSVRLFHTLSRFTPI